MRNMEFLTEKDLEYFRKKEEKGEAIIINIDPDALMRMDLDAVFADLPKDQTLSPDELQDILSRQGLTKPAGEKKEQTAEAIPMDTLEEKILAANLSDDAMDLITRAIGEGFSDSELLLLLKNSSSYGDMKDTFSLLEGVKRF